MKELISARPQHHYGVHRYAVDFRQDRAELDERFAGYCETLMSQ